MLGLFRNRTYISGIVLFCCLLGTGFFIQRFQTPDSTVYEGTYPGIQGIIEPQYSFNEREILLKFDATVSTDALVVFVYDDEGCQYGMMKSIRDDTIRITEQDFPEYQAVFNGKVVEGYRIFRRVNGKPEARNFFSLMQDAKARNLRFGVQQCMYPVCTRCLDVCPVISKGVIEMHQAEGGQILPFVLFGSCPRSGKCFTVCTLGAFYKADMRHVQVNPQNTLKLETNLRPKVLQ